jgi:glycine hydroxymethyltransferase
MSADDMARIAAWIDAAVEAAKREDEDALDAIAAEVRDFTAAFPIPGLVA